MRIDRAVYYLSLERTHIHPKKKHNKDHQQLFRTEIWQTRMREIQVGKIFEFSRRGWLVRWVPIRVEHQRAPVYLK